MSAPELLVFTALAALAGSFVQSAGGFGYAIVCMSVWPLFLPFRTASILEAVTAFFMVVYIAVRLRKAIRWRALWPPVLASLACGWLGVDTLMRLDDAVLRRILGASLLVLACYFLFLSEKIRLKGGIAAGLAAGAVSGFCGGLFNIGGPPAVAYFLAVAHSKEEYNATLQAYFCLTTLNIFGVHFLRGNVTAAMLPLFAAALAGVGAGTLLGFAVFRRLTMQDIRKFIYGFMTAAGLYLLLRG